MTHLERRSALFVVLLWALLVQLMGWRAVLLMLCGVVCGVVSAWLMQHWREGG